VFTVLGHEDQRHAGRSFVALHVINIDPAFDEASDSLVAKHVLTNASDKRHRAACLRSRDRLIGAFAASSRDKLAAENRFARLGNSVELENHVGIRATDDYYLGFHYDPPSGVLSVNTYDSWTRRSKRRLTALSAGE